MLAAPHVDHVRVGRGDGDRTDAARLEVAVGDVAPRDAGVVGAPDALRPVIPAKYVSGIEGIPSIALARPPRDGPTFRQRIAWKTVVSKAVVAGAAASVAASLRLDGERKGEERDEERGGCVEDHSAQSGTDTERV